jgi:hypothetical protein
MLRPRSSVPPVVRHTRRHRWWGAGAVGALLGVLALAVPGGAAAAAPPVPKGWLYTSGNRIYLSTGTTGTPWMGRGVNMDDIFMCGYNTSLWYPSPDTAMIAMADRMLWNWKPTFVRVSLAMDSDQVQTSWTSNPGQYATPMTNVIKFLGAHAGVTVLVTLRSHTSMVGEDTTHGDPEATGIPSAATDATYRALVGTFAHSPFVMFGLSNEPGGNTATDQTIASAMTHSVGVIRAEEDRLGVPHHVVAVQGNVWTSDISYYAGSPLSSDNVVYEVHGYPPPASSYTYSNLPVILGEYGSLGTGAASFYADVEKKQIPSLAWDFDPFSGCAPDLVEVSHDPSRQTPTAWGRTVRSYLLSHSRIVPIS